MRLGSGKVARVIEVAVLATLLALPALAQTRGGPNAHGPFAFTGYILGGAFLLVMVFTRAGRHILLGYCLLVGGMVLMAGGLFGMSDAHGFVFGMDRVQAAVVGAAFLSVFAWLMSRKEK